MTTQEEMEWPGGSGLWAPVVPEPREPQEWVSQDGEDELIVKSID